MSDVFQDVLLDLGLIEFHAILIENDIDETMLHDLSDADLREMKLSLGQRKRFMTALKAAAPAHAAAPAPQAERRQLTVVFCDLVGSTKLATALDIEDLRVVMSTYHNVSQSVMRAHGGHIAYTQGDGIMVYFGYPSADEDDAARAVRAALATVEAVAGIITPASAGLAVRIGIATGIVVVGDMIGTESAQRDFVVGETPNLASRLQSLAAPGEVLVAQETRDLAGRAFEYENRGAPQIKGFPPNLNVYRVLEETEVHNRFDIRAAEGLGPLIGRRTEIGKLVNLWDTARRGNGRFCQIEGPAGIGKSRLARAVVEHLGSAPPRMIEWQCASHLSQRALHPVTRELARAAGLNKTDTPQSARAKLAAFVETAPGLGPDDLPLLADSLNLVVDGAVDGAVPQDAQARAGSTLKMLMRWIEGMASDGPVLLTLEDAHWADTPTQEFIQALTQRVQDLPVLLMVTFRPEFEPPWSLTDTGSHLSLEPLDTAAGVRLIRQVSGLRELPTVVAREIIQKTDGVPLFLEELTKVVLETAMDGDGPMEIVSLDSISIPATLHDSLMARLDRIGTGKEVAQLGSVIGREFTVGMLEAIAQDGLQVKDGLAQLHDAGLIYRTADGLHGDSYVFNHALVQDVAYASILKSNRKDIHTTLANVMMDGHAAFGSPEHEVLARHCDVAGLTGPAMQNWLAAGQHALEHANNLAAVSYLRSALRQLAQLPDGPEKAQTELAAQMMLAPACMAIYGWGSREVEQTCARARELAFDLGNSEALFGALWGLWTNYFLRGELVPAMATALETDAMAQAAGVPMLLTAADHAVGYSHYYRGEYAQALERAERGIARYTPEDEIGIIQTFQFSSTVALRAIRSASLWLMGRTAEADAAFEEGLQFAQDVNHLPSLAYGLGSAGQELTLRRDWERLEQIADRCLRLSQDQGFILWERVAAVQLAIVRGKRGMARTAIAEIDVERGRFFATQTVLTDVLIFPAFAELMIEAGELDQARRRLDKVIVESERRMETLNLSEVYRIRGETNLRRGDRDAALADFEKAVEVAGAQGSVRLESMARDSLARMKEGRATTVAL
jgi:class 3 adenylate cyclase/tetratricopeptide (TPR) repeat protein